MQSEVNSCVQSLDGFWEMLLDPVGFGETNGKYQLPEVENANFYTDRKILNYRPVIVPSSWTQLPDMKWYREIAWYIKRFDWQKIEGQRVFVRFEAVNYHSKVWLNGILLGTHEGGYTPFEFEITDSVRAGSNYLAVKISPVPGPDSTVPVTGWCCHPGIIRSVSLITTPPLRIVSAGIVSTLGEQDRNCEVAVAVELEGKTHKAELVVKIFDPAGQPVGEVRGDAKDHFIKLGLKLKNPELWSPDSPNLYLAEIALRTAEGTQTRNETFGVRRFEVKPDGFYLNGSRIFIKGAGMHAMYPGLGHTIPDEIYRRDYTMMKEAGMNAVRLVHYPHDRRALDLADKMGLLVWAEIPLYWKARKDNDGTRQSALNQLREMIVRDRNHPCVFTWGLGNEIPTSDPASVSFFKEARALAAELDPSRSASFISEQTASSSDDKGLAYSDFISCNIYLGWYSQELETMPSILDAIAKSFPEKPILMTEFGAGAVRGYKSGAEAPVPWSEEYQAWVLKANIEYFMAHPRVGGCFVWCWADFEDPTRRDNIYERGFNNKGLVDPNRVPKVAYTTVAQLFRNKGPFPN